MKRSVKILLASLCSAALLVPVLAFAGCGEKRGGGDESVDYVSELKLDMTSNTKKQEVRVHLYIDGDTTHFYPKTNSTVANCPSSDFAQTEGLIKARYLAVNTPESTGKIEKWGKTASLFTYDKLSNASSIIVESDDNQWNIDSTGERYTLWIWYKPKDGGDYRNLNVEILQNGFAWASSTANNRYGDIATKALEQAQKEQLHVFSPANTVDVNYYGDNATELDLKELRCHIEDYLQKPVRVEGVVTAVFDNTAYIEEQDTETGEYYGMQVYYGFTKDSVISVLSVGNRVSVWGTVSIFPADATLENGTVQISGVEHNDYRPDSKKNTNVIGEVGAYKGAFTTITPADLEGEVTVDFEVENEDGDIVNQPVTIAKGEARMGTSVTMENLKVVSSYTTGSGASKGAISLTCSYNGSTIVVRTEVLTDGDGNLVEESMFAGKTITVRGIVNKYDGAYQVNVYQLSDITFVS